MLKGMRILYATALAIIYELKESIFQVTDLGTLFVLFDQQLKSDTIFYTERFYRLIGLYYDLVKEDYVEYERNQCRFDVEKELQSVITSRDASMSGASKKMHTINKFYLQGGIDSNADYSGDTKSVEQMQADIILRFDCNP